MKKILTPTQRLIVAADFDTNHIPLQPTGAPQYARRHWGMQQVLELANQLRRTGVCLKVNSDLRAYGYDLIDGIRSRGLSVFADLKLFDIDNTLSRDGMFLAEAKPELLTVSCLSEVAGMRALKAQLPNTEVLGVTILTSQTEAICKARFGLSTVEDCAVMLAKLADEAELDGVISSAKEATAIRRNIRPEMTINTPAIRPSWAVVLGDDQNPDRIMTPTKAIKAGADRIVVGRPILNPPDGMSSHDAVMRIIEEIASAVA